MQLPSTLHIRGLASGASFSSLLSYQARCKRCSSGQRHAWSASLQAMRHQEACGTTPCIMPYIA